MRDVALIPAYSCRRKSLADSFPRPVGRGVVDHHDFCRRQFAVEDAVQADLELGPIVPRNDDHGERRISHSQTPTAIFSLLGSPLGAKPFSQSAARSEMLVVSSQYLVGEILAIAALSQPRDKVPHTLSVDVAHRVGDLL